MRNSLLHVYYFQVEGNLLVELPVLFPLSTPFPFVGELWKEPTEVLAQFLSLPSF